MFLFHEVLLKQQKILIDSNQKLCKTYDMILTLSNNFWVLNDMFKFYHNFISFQALVIDEEMSERGEFWCCFPKKAEESIILQKLPILVLLFSYTIWKQIFKVLSDQNKN
jgi:hypothetical protein